MKKSLFTLFLVAILIALIIGCSNLGVPIGTVSNDDEPAITAMNEPLDTSENVPAETAVNDSVSVVEEEPSDAALTTEDIVIAVNPSQEEGFNNEYRAEADLDGDSTGDLIILKTEHPVNENEVSAYVLVVNDQMIANIGERIDPYFHVVDIDPEDSYREIAVSEEGPSNDYLTVFYRYKNGELSVLGTIQGFLGNYPGTEQTGDVIVIGNGTVKTRTRGLMIQTWYYDDMYRLTEHDELLKEDKELYPFDTEVVILKELKTVKSREDTSPAYTYTEGERATLLETDEIEWVSIKNEAGEISWFRVKNHMLILGQDTEGYGMDFFEGLNMAD